MKHTKTKTQMEELTSTSNCNYYYYNPNWYIPNLNHHNHVLLSQTLIKPKPSNPTKQKNPKKKIKKFHL